jgi:glycosyltransferase involved in cell wall biosynthesis
VIIPTFNHAQYLRHALQTVLDQSYENWEVIIIDNFSTDETEAVIASFSDSRISYKKNHNGGVIAVSRNAGIFLAKGEWVAFLDSDDFWAANKLQVCLEHVSNNVDLIYHDMVVVGDQSKTIRQREIKSWQVNTPIVIDLMVRGNTLTTSSVMVRTRLLKQVNGMNESYGMVAAEDYNTWLRISQLSDGFKHIPKKLGFYRVHNIGISSSKDMSLPTSHALVGFIDLLSQKQRRKLEAELSYTRGRFNYLSGNFIEARKYLWDALKYTKFSIKFKAVLMLVMSRMI